MDVSKNDFSKTINFFKKSKININNLKQDNFGF